jgi:hypothetical protein
MASIALYSHRPDMYNMVPSIVSTEMWLEGAPHNLYRSFNLFGICQGVDASRRRVDDIRIDFDLKIREWKQHQEVIFHYC